MACKRAFSLVLIILLQTVFGSGFAAAQIQGDFPEVVLFAEASMEVGASAQVFSGDVVVNDAPPAAAGTLVFGNKAKAPASWEVKANSILVGNNVTLAGAEFCNLGNISSCSPLSPPVYTLLPLFHPSTPGGSNVNVPGGGSATLTGDAMDITVGANGTLVFTPGIHNVRSITANNKTNLVFSGPTEVRVQNGMSLGLESNINKFAGAAAKDVVFYVGGNASLGSKGDVKANFYVPFGTLELPSNSINFGAFLAKNLIVGSKAQVTLASAFVNHPPVAVDDSLTVTEDDPATPIAVLPNDSDPDGDPIMVAAVDDPPNGTASTDGTAVFYKPDPDFFGADVFSYQVCDTSTAINNDNCSSATITVTVTSVNDPPVAVDDAVSTPEETLISIDALANDTAGPANENQARTLDSVGQAASGAVAIVGGKIDYTPGDDFFGNDTFPYTVCDGGADDDTGTDGDDLCASASVTVTVTNVNDAPTADPQDLFATTTVTITLTGSDPDGDSLTFSLLAGPTKGTLDTAITPIVPSGGGPVVSATVDYTPTSCTGDPVECDEDSFSFQVDDGNAGTASATVTINPGGDATPPPDPIVVIDAKDQTLELASGQTVSIVLHASAPQAPQPEAIGDLSFAITSPPSLGGITAGPTSQPETPVRSARITYEHTGANGTESIAFEACELAVPTNCDSATVTIQIADFAPPAAPVARDISAASEAQNSVVFSLLATEGNPPDDPPTGGGGRSFAQGTAFASEAGSQDNGALKNSGSGVFGNAQTLGLTLDSGWQIFTWWDEVGAQGPPEPTCTGPGPLVEAAPNLEGPFTFTVPAGQEACLSVTDVLLTGDQFRVLNGGSEIDITNPVPQGGPSVGDDPDAAFASTAYSHRLIPLSSDSYSIEIETIPGNSLWCGRGYIRVDSAASGNCDEEPPLLTFTVLTVPDGSFGTLFNSSGQAISQGTVLSNPTITFTPTATTGTNSQTTYVATNTSTGLVSNVATINLAIVAEVLANQCQVDEQFCDKGRDLGGGQGLMSGGSGEGGGLRQGPSITVSVSGPGDVASSRPHLDGETYTGLVCGSGGACSAKFVKGSTVVLYARPIGANSEFVEWGGDCRGTELAALVRPGIDTFCTATFREKKE